MQLNINGRVSLEKGGGEGFRRREILINKFAQFKQRKTVQFLQDFGLEKNRTGAYKMCTSSESDEVDEEAE